MPKDWCFIQNFNLHHTSQSRKHSKIMRVSLKNAESNKLAAISNWSFKNANGRDKIFKYLFKLLSPCKSSILWSIKQHASTLLLLAYRKIENRNMEAQYTGHKYMKTIVIIIGNDEEADQVRFHSLKSPSQSLDYQ